jgi:hypothetical protein
VIDVQESSNILENLNKENENSGKKPSVDSQNLIAKEELEMDTSKPRLEAALDWIVGIKEELKKRINSKTFRQRITLRGSATEKLLKLLDSRRIFNEAEKLADFVKEQRKIRVESKDIIESKNKLEDLMEEEPDRVAELCTNTEYVLSGMMEEVMDEVKKIVDRAPKSSYLKDSKFQYNLNACLGNLKQLSAYYKNLWETVIKRMRKEGDKEATKELEELHESTKKLTEKKDVSLTNLKQGSKKMESKITEVLVEIKEEKKNEKEEKEEKDKLDDEKEEEKSKKKKVKRNKIKNE